ncbi:antibiotic biosynthesis monooxygenase [Halobacterium hubeiense]|uniref:antibiotic biosynthesis monooxygenase n=1 Tax=Halobacterium hubeiense TaxID=1407499 RepID=UPI003C71368A
MIARVWRGWTEPADADEYESFVTERVFPDAKAEIDELQSFEVLRREAGDEVEFVTIARFASWDGVAAFAGEDYETAHVPERAEQLLARYEETVAHHEVRA